MELFLQRTVDGLSEGSVYALLALGLVIIYRGTGHLNFAHGEMALFCAYAVYQFGEWGIPIGIAVVMGMGVGFLVGATAEVALVRPVARKSAFAVFIVTIGLFQFLNWLDGAIWGGQQLPNTGVGSKQISYPSLFPSADTDFVSIFGAEITIKSLGTIGLVLVLSAVLFFVFNRTKLGLAMRAVASNADSAKLVGIRTNTVLMLSWRIAAAIGALGGVVTAGNAQSVSQSLMFSVFIYASAAATLGGFDSPLGAVVGGLAIGVIQNLTAGYVEWVGQEMKVGVSFLVIVAVLLVKPSGLFGTAKVERV
ncbi:MAG: branched-chain amino acid ABC transporter permease [Acidimicrobiaceae bacterium]|nr:branched-chain amino acid ABC transporter permease [Acidimicrobiaceae bacterium]